MFIVGQVCVLVWCLPQSVESAGESWQDQAEHDSEGMKPLRAEAPAPLIFT